MSKRDDPNIVLTSDDSSPQRVIPVSMMLRVPPGFITKLNEFLGDRPSEAKLKLVSAKIREYYTEHGSAWVAQDLAAALGREVLLLPYLHQNYLRWAGGVYAQTFTARLN